MRVWQVKPTVTWLKISYLKPNYSTIMEAWPPYLQLTIFTLERVMVHECKHTQTHTHTYAKSPACVCVDVEDEAKTPGRLQLLLCGAFRDSRWIGPRTELCRDGGDMTAFYFHPHYSASDLLVHSHSGWKWIEIKQEFGLRVWWRMRNKIASCLEVNSASTWDRTTW